MTLFYLVLDIGDQELVSKYRIWYIVGTRLFYRLLVIGCSLGLPWICVFQTLFSPSPACCVLSGQALRPLLGQADADSRGRLPFPLLPSHMSAAHVFLLLSFISLHIFRLKTCFLLPVLEPVGPPVTCGSSSKEKASSQARFMQKCRTWGKSLSKSFSQRATWPEKTGPRVLMI